MALDYSGQNLRGRSFRGQDLTGADFSGADIRSADFSNAILVDANFNRAKAGLQTRWAIFLVAISWVLMGLSGFLSAFAGYLVAEAIAQHIPYVIGMNQAIGDKAAIKFATGFYSALGAGESVEFAYKLGCSVIQLDGIAEHLTPVLKKK